MAQRITNGMMINSFNRNLQANTKRMSAYQQQLATNRKLVRLSDDPVSVVKLVDAKGKLSDIEQYQKNLQDAGTWLTHTESALNEMNTILKRSFELATYAANDVLDDNDRQAIAEEIGQLRDQIAALSNTALGSKYVFGGYNVSLAPFEPDPETGDIEVNGESMVYGDGDGEHIFYELNFGLDFDVAISANQFMGVGEDKNIYYQMTRFYQTLMDPETCNNDSIRPFIGVMEDLQKDVLTNLADVGGRQSRIELMENRFAQDNINYTQMKSDIEDLDQAEAIMQFSMAEAVYRAALSVGGRVIQPTLVDFLK